MFARRLLYVVVSGFVFLAAACGGDDETLSTTTESPGTTTPPTTLATTEPPEGPGSATGDDRSDELLGRWEVVGYQLPGGGGFTNVVGDEPVYIEFNADGALTYNTGCNSGSTAYTASGTYYVRESALDDNPEGQPITIGPAFEQTERGCEGFLGDQDRDLPDDMAAATRFILDGDQLLLLDEFRLIEATKSG